MSLLKVDTISAFQSGEITISDNQLINAQLNVTDGITGSLLGTSSYATFAEDAVSSSYAGYAVSASYAISASYEILYEVSSSYADTAISSSHAVNADNVVSASHSVNSDNSILATTALTSSHAVNLVVDESLEVNGLVDGIAFNKFATTGSNNFAGEQTIDGTLEANSIDLPAAAGGQGDRKSVV